MRIVLLLGALVLAGLAAFYVLGPAISEDPAVQVEPGGVAPSAVEPPAAVTEAPEPAEPLAPEPPATDEALTGIAAQTEAAAEAITRAEAARAEAEAAERAASQAEARRLQAILDDPDARLAALSVEGFDPAVARAAIEASALSGPQKLELKRALESAGDVEGEREELQALLDQIKAAPSR